MIFIKTFLIDRYSMQLRSSRKKVEKSFLSAEKVKILSKRKTSLMFVILYGLCFMHKWREIDKKNGRRVNFTSGCKGKVGGI